MIKEEKNEKSLFILKIILLIIAYSFVGLFGLFIILVSKVNALTLSPSAVQCSWNTNASTTNTVNCLTTEPNVGGYTNYINILQTYSSNQGSQLWTIRLTYDMYVIDYNNADGEYIQTPNIKFYVGGNQQNITNLSTIINTQRADCEGNNANNCYRIRTFTTTFQWNGDINGTTIINIGSASGTGDCGWLTGNLTTCTSSYPRIHYLSADVYYNDGEQYNKIEDSINNQTTIINGTIQGVGDNIINSQNNMTDSINNNNNKNTQDIIDNQNANNQALQDNIDSQFNTCENYSLNANNTSGERGILKNDGTLNTGSVNSRHTSEYIPVNKDKSYTLTLTGRVTDPSYCLYGTNKSLISCTNYNRVQTFTITPQTNGFIRFSWYDDWTGDKFTFTGEYCYNRLDKENENLDNINDTLNDSSVDNPTSNLEGLENSFGTNSVISDLLLLPVRLYQNVLNSINGSCSPFNLGTLYGHQLTMPCLNINGVIGSAIYGVIDVLISGLFILSIRKKFVDIFESFTSLKVGGNELE